MRFRRTLLVLVAAVVALVAVNLTVQHLRDADAGPAGKKAVPRIDVPDAPAATPPIGSFVDSQVMADGDVRVRQWIRASTPVDRLDLTTADPDALPGTVEASPVVVSAPDGSRLGLRRSVGTKTQQVRLREPATELYMTYVISGETVSDETSTVSGRTLARVVAMDVSFEGEAGPTVRRVRGSGAVLNVACLDPTLGSQTPPRACGAPSGDGTWQVELRGERRHERLLVQLGPA